MGCNGIKSKRKKHLNSNQALKVMSQAPQSTWTQLHNIKKYSLQQKDIFNRNSVETKILSFIHPFHPFSSRYPGWGCRDSSLSREAQTSLSMQCKLHPSIHPSIKLVNTLHQPLVTRPAGGGSAKGWPMMLPQAQHLALPPSDITWPWGSLIIKILWTTLFGPSPKTCLCRKTLQGPWGFNMGPRIFGL